MVRFMQGLQELGWGIGRNLRIDTRWAAGDTGRIRSLASEMVALGPDVIFTGGFSTIRPLLEATSTIPIVFANVVDPVGAGFVASLARPGGNITASPATSSASHQVAGIAKADRARRHAGGRAARSYDFRPSSASSRPFRAWHHLSVWKWTPIDVRDGGRIGAYRRNIRTRAH